jgi:UDP-4-amino-4-deoxy-L-arabinose-oxoglutarate aminotransferase
LSEPDFIPFCRPTIEDEEIASVVESLKSGWITTGPKVQAFEKVFRDRLGVPHALALNSGTAALHVLLAAMNLAPGDEVMSTSLTWPSTFNDVELLGLRSVFVDVLPGTLLMDPADVKRKLTKRTKAVVPVHFAGAPADLDAIAAAAPGVPIVEDAAHAVGTFYKGVEVGARATSAVFSFHPIKNVTTGEGGIVTTRDDGLAEQMKLLRFHGVNKDSAARYAKTASPRYEVKRPGWKYNMLDLQAAIGVEQMKKLERFNGARAEQAARYAEALRDVPEIAVPQVPAYDHVHAWHLYVIQVDVDALTTDRDAFMAEMGKRGIGVGLHFTPVHLHSYYREKYGAKPGDLPVTERACERIVSLPLYPRLSRAEQDRVVAAVKDVVRAHRRDGRRGR